MISQELLSEVLPESEESTSYGILPETNLLLIQYGDYDDTINIYELAWKCKKWIDNNTKYSIWSELNHARVTSMFDLQGKEDKQFKADTEPEAIFMACEWIKDNK